MKPILFLAAAAALCGATVASAQTGGSIASAPANNSTGPTISDTRAVDQNTVNTPAGSGASSTSNTPNSYGNWRTSSGLNADPDNPNGAPGPSSGLGGNTRR